MQDTLAAESISDATSVRPRRGRWIALLRLGAAGLVLFLLWKFVFVTFTGNLHTVIPGRLYRGGQPTARSLETIVKKYHIRTVINVRGCCYPDDWFVEEARTCQRLGVQLESVTFSASHLPSRHELRQLVEVLDRAEYPAFIHCRQGADRTGMASLIALLLRDEYSYADARPQLGVHYGHMAFSKSGVLDRFFGLYEKWLAETRREHNPERLRHWLAKEYTGGWCDARLEKVQHRFDHARVGEPLAYDLVVRNTSDSPWQFQPLRTAGNHVAYRLIDAKRDVVMEGRAGLLERTVAPGEKIQVALIVPPIQKAGKYRLLIDMIEEGHCWFHQTGSELWDEELTVRE